MNTAVVTGAGGFIGARLVQRLLGCGWRVYALGRGRDGQGWHARMLAALDAIAGRPVDRGSLSQLLCLEADLLDPGLGLSETGFARGAVLFHVAADTRFQPPDPAAQRRVNVAGALHVMERLGGAVRRAVHVSTAYVAGDRRGLVRESELDAGQAFHNAYEASKREAEAAVSELCGRIGVPLVIVRPSIIINDTQTGRSSTFTHLNALVEVVSRIQEHYGIGDGQVVSRRVRVAVDPRCRPNLAPVDPIVAALQEVGLHPESPGRTYHLCHPAPQTNAEVLALLAEAFGVLDKLEIAFVPNLEEPATWTERMVARSFKPYLPYLNHDCEFDLTHTRALIPDYDARFPAIGLNYLRKVFAFQRAQGAKALAN